MDEMRRSGMEIKGDILEVCTIPEKPTRIMYRTNTSWQPLVMYLEELQEKGFIEEMTTQEYRERYIQNQDGRRRGKIDKRTRYYYVTTKEGIKILRLYKNFKGELRG